MKKEKRILAKILSVLTALALFAGIMPVIDMPAAQATGETVVYDFSGTYSSAGPWSENALGTNYLNPTTALGEYATSSSYTNTNWAFYAMSNINKGEYFQRGWGYYLMVKPYSNPKGWFAFKLKDIPVGESDTEFCFAGYSGGMHGRMYLIPIKDISENTDAVIESLIADDTYLFANINAKTYANQSTTTGSNSGTSQDNKTCAAPAFDTSTYAHNLYKYGKVNVTKAQEYIFVIQADGLGELRFKSLTLTPSSALPDACVAEIEASVDKSTIAVGETAQVSVSNAKTMNGTVLSDFATDSEITYSSSDTNIATVDANGIVTPGSEMGTTTITAKVVKEGGFATDTVDVTVASAYKTTTYDFRLAGSGEFAAGTIYSNNEAFANATNPTGLHTANDANIDYKDMFCDGVNAWWGFVSTQLKLDGNNKNKNAWFAFELDAPEAGTYTPELNYDCYTYTDKTPNFSDGMHANIYLIPESALTSTTIAQAIADDTYLIANQSFRGSGNKTRL